MKLAIMQPYFFPYIGYFQLIYLVDKFVFYDDVNFMKQSWINRNRILLNNEVHTFSVPIEDMSSFRPINNTKISYKKDWRTKLVKTFEQAYMKAPFFSAVFEIIKVLLLEKKFEFISDLAKQSILLILDYLEIETKIILTSSMYHNNSLKGQKRVIDICEKEGADTYINPPGGIELYDREIFKTENIELKFISPGLNTYKQLTNKGFIPNLSIIDVLMFNPKNSVKLMLNNYKFI